MGAPGSVVSADICRSGVTRVSRVHGGNPEEVPLTRIQIDGRVRAGTVLCFQNGPSGGAGLGYFNLVAGDDGFTALAAIGIRGTISRTFSCDVTVRGMIPTHVDFGVPGILHIQICRRVGTERPGRLARPGPGGETPDRGARNGEGSLPSSGRRRSTSFSVSVCKHVVIVAGPCLVAAGCKGNSCMINIGGLLLAVNHQEIGDRSVEGSLWSKLSFIRHPEYQ